MASSESQTNYKNRLNRKETKERQGFKIKNKSFFATFASSWLTILNERNRIHRHPNCGCRPQGPQSARPGLLESADQACLAYKLRQRGLNVDSEVVQPIAYDGLQLDAGYRVDMLVEDCIIIENKCVEKLLHIHMAQILTYLKLRKLKLGFIINWHALMIRDGIKRVANKL